MTDFKQAVWLYTGSSASCQQDWYVVLEEEGSVVCIFFDLSKAYLIMNSFAKVGICRALYDWFGDYQNDV